MSDCDIYPWQQEQWDGCLARLDQNKMPHALLVHGEAGIGVSRFAERLVQTLLCNGSDKPCENCRGCRLHAGRNHPDFREVTAEKEGGEIKVGQIRDILPFIQIPRHYDTSKVVLFSDADTMNRAAANSLLKMLEEPPADTLMMLVSHYPFRLPATVRSRCQTVRLRCPDQHQAECWLAATAGISSKEAECRLNACNGHPLRALEADDSTFNRENFRQDITDLVAGQGTLIELSAKWQEQPVATVHQWLLESAEEAIRAELGKEGTGLPLHKLFSFYDRQKYRCLSIKARLNPRLLLESALIEWLLVCSVE